MKTAQKQVAPDYETVQFRLDDLSHTRKSARPPQRIPSQEPGEAKR
jgi:hypothetical protein